MTLVSLAGPRGFRFKPTVLSHGWVFLAPFRWDGSVLQFPFRSREGRPYELALQGGPGRTVYLETRAPKALLPESEAAARWVLRLDEDLSELRRSAKHDPLVLTALRRGAGRLLRAPTIWEEAVRVLCTTNIQWAGTVTMMRGLTELGKGHFPSPSETLRLSEGRLQREARMGYRAASLLELAEHFRSNDREHWKQQTPDEDTLRKEIAGWRGFGPYAVAHMLVQLGHYGTLPVDSEVRAFHQDEGLSDREIHERYAPYGRYAFLAYKLRRIAMKKNWIGAP